MARLARKDLKTPFLHVMVQGVNKEYIFENNYYIEKYLGIIRKNLVDYNITIIAYCIMNNHAHFLIFTKDIEELGKFMHKCNLNYAQMYNKDKNRTGVLFRNRYQTEPIYDTKYLINCIKYIHNNPVKANMVLKPEEYKYSNYNDFINNKGATQTRIMQKIYGAKCNYGVLFKESFEKRFLDIKDELRSSKEYVIAGIKAYQKQKNKTLSQVLMSRDILKELISFLYNEYGLKYVEISNFFEIQKGTMNELKKNN